MVIRLKDANIGRHLRVSPIHYVLTVSLLITAKRVHKSSIQAIFRAGYFAVKLFGVMLLNCRLGYNKYD